MRILDPDLGAAPLRTVRTGHRGFCAAATGEIPNLLICPCGDDGAELHDLREPVRKGTEGGGCASLPFGGDGRGMLSSLALCGGGGGPSVVSAGMDDGRIIFRDLRFVGGAAPLPDGELRFGRDPVLCMSMRSVGDGFRGVAGAAGDADEISSKPKRERGTVLIFHLKQHGLTSDHFRPCTVARHTTCSQSSGGRPGVSSCAVRGDGRVCAIGGWDRRVRIYDTKRGRPLAVLKCPDGAAALRGGLADLRETGKGSASAVDFADGWDSSFLVAGYGDGRACIWDLSDSSCPPDRL